MIEEDYESDDESVNSDDTDDDEAIENESDFPIDAIIKEETFRSALISWALQHRITRSALQEISALINDLVEKPLLPRDPRTLLETPTSIEISRLGVDQMYWHNGLELCLRKLFKNISASLDISLNINMDGLPIFKSSKGEFWPILANIAEIPDIKPIIIGVYYGKAKASNLNAYLTPFVDELAPILKNGILINGHKISLKIRCFICDSPARAFIKGKY